MTLVVDLADRGVNPAEGTGEPYDCWLEVDREQRHAIICWRESLAFHAELARSDEQRFGHGSVAVIGTAQVRMLGY